MSNPRHVVIFEETVPKYLDQAKTSGFDLTEMRQQGHPRYRAVAVHRGGG